MKDGKDLRPTPGGDRHARYDPLSQLLHWATAVLVLASFALAIWPGLTQGSAALHKSIGVLVLLVVPLRLIWRLTGGAGGALRPGGDGGVLAAKAVHAALYAMLLAVPLLGWLHLNAKGLGVSAFGLPLPMLADTDREFARALLRAKWWLAYGMLGAIGLHAAAALAHHYLLRDGVLASMLPGSLRRLAAADRPGTVIVTGAAPARELA